MVSQDINIKINLRDNASANAKKVDTNIRGLGTSGNFAAAGITKMLGPLTAALTSIQALRKAITGISSAIKLFSDFDDTMRKVKAVTKATDSEFQAMVKTAKQLGATTRYTARESAEALTFLGMAGFSASEAIEALPNVLNLAAAGGLELGTAADIATNILSGFGLEVDQLSRVNDVLAEAFTSSNTSLTELGEGFKYVGPIAKGVGADFEDLIASMGKLGDAGIKGSLAGTTLRGIIEALFNPTREEAALMEQLSKRIGGVGLQIRNRKGDFIGFTRIVEQLEKAGLKGDEALKLFGARAGPGMAALVQVGSEALGELVNQLDTVDNVTGKIKQDMEGGIGGAFRNLASAAEGFKIQLGEAFSKGLIVSIQEVTSIFQKLNKTITELDQSGVIGKITKAVEILTKTFSYGLDFAIAYAKEFTNAYGILFNAVTLNFDRVKERLDNVGKSFREMLQERNLIGSDLEIQLALTNHQISNIEKQIDVTQKKIEQDREDLNGWRAKIAGAKQYEEQLARHNEELQNLLRTAWQLNETKVKIETDIKLENLSESIVNEIRSAEKEIGKIGTGSKEEVKNDLAEQFKKNQELIDAENRKLRESNKKLISDLRIQSAELESKYKKDEITLKQYYDGRKKIVEQSVNSELEILQNAANKEVEGSDKASKIDAKIYDAKQKLNAELIGLDTEYYLAAKKLKEKELKDAEKLQKQKLASEQAFKDIEARIKSGGGRNLEGEFMQEMADLQERQNRELEIIRKGAEDEIAIERYKSLQKKEIAQLEHDQYKRLMFARLEIARETFGGVSQAFSDLYELSGQKQKEWFYLAKAAALAEVAVNTAQGIMKAWAQGGIYGAVGAALVSVQGAIQTAKIVSTGLASGGVVPGYSPNDKADNIPARLTAGEFVQPVDTVKHYGVNLMEALRQKVIPRSAFGYAGIRADNIPKLRYAEGGSVAAIGSQSNDQSQKENITIINYTDRQELLSALSTKDGINAIVNVISANREKVSRVLR